MGPVSIELYNKFGLILRIETTVNDLTFFKHYREVEHRGGSRETEWASMQKTSADYRTKRSAVICTRSTAARHPVCSTDSEPMDSCRKT